MRIRRGMHTLLIDSRFCGTDLERMLLEGSSGLQKHCATQSIQSAITARVIRCAVDVGDQVVTVYHKDYLHRSLWDAVKHIVRPSRARRAFNASLMLAAEGFGVPEVVALGETRSTLVPKSCFLVTCEVSESERVLVLLGGSIRTPSPLSLRAKRDLLRALGRTVGQMHQAGIVHGDLRLSNVLARCENGRWKLFFLDNERTRRWPRLPTRLRVKNLVQLNMLTRGISATDRLRLFLAYVSEHPDIAADYKQWAREIHRKTARRLSAKLSRSEAMA